MKVLLSGINFAPELTGIGKYTGELAAWLAARGHQVRVVTAPPYYPAWAVSPGFANAYRTEQWQGVQVLRCPLWVATAHIGTELATVVQTCSLIVPPEDPPGCAGRAAVVVVGHPNARRLAGRGLSRHPNAVAVE